MTRGTSDWKFLLLTAGIVALLGFQATRELLHEESAGPASAELGRRPASLGAKNLAMKLAIPRPDVLLEWDWSCRKNAPATAEVDGNQLRLKGKACDHAFSPEKLTITNVTNGFTASIFDKGHREYETDLIQLNAGSNEIHLRYAGQGEDEKADRILVIQATGSL